jgi:hypothetical protein
MGYKLSAVCEKCSFEKHNLSFGANRFNYESVCHVPCLEATSGELIVANYLDVENVNANMKFYTHSDMYQTKLHELKDDYLEWGRLHLKIHENKCPACHEFTMQFVVKGHFD